jgi:hypothetical protein
VIGKAISTDVETGSTRLQTTGQISFLEYLNCLPEEIEPEETYLEERLQS